MFLLKSKYFMQQNCHSQSGYCKPVFNRKQPRFQLLITSSNCRTSVLKFSAPDPCLGLNLLKM